MTNITDSACYYSPVIIKDMPQYAVLTGQETILKTFEYEKQFKVWSRVKGTFEAQICIQMFFRFLLGTFLIGSHIWEAESTKHINY